jgi:uncharacterized protein YjbI with pentapeptide repeats
MGEQTDHRPASPPRPSGDDPQAWQGYWQQMGQPWRMEPEIDTKRQEYLAGQREIVPNIVQGIYPFKNVKLSRADVEWLLATHEHGRGPVDWSDESQRERMGVDVRGADLRQADLKNLPLARLVGGLPEGYWSDTPIERAEMATVHMQGANLRESHLEGAYLYLVNLEGAHLNRAHLEEAELISANLLGAELNEVHLEGAYLMNTRLAGNLRKAHLQRAHLVGTGLESVWLEGAMLADENHIGPRLADARWGESNLAVVDWSQVNILGDEQLARQAKTNEGEVKDRETRLEEYEMAVRANRRLALALLAQGMNEDGSRFAYRAQCLQRGVLWFQMIGHGKCRLSELSSRLPSFLSLYKRTKREVAATSAAFLVIASFHLFFAALAAFQVGFFSA